MRALFLMVMLAACGGVATPVRPPAVDSRSTVVFFLVDDHPVAVACWHAGTDVMDGRDCAQLLPAAAAAPACSPAGFGDGMSVRYGIQPPSADARIRDVPSEIPMVSAAERALLRAQLVRTDASLTGDPELVQVVSADLDGDGKPDRVYSLALPNFSALALVTGAHPDKVRFLLFSDSDRYHVMALVDLNGKGVGRQILYRAASATSAEVGLLKATGELIGHWECGG